MASKILPMPATASRGDEQAGPPDMPWISTLQEVTEKLDGTSASAIGPGSLLPPADFLAKAEAAMDEALMARCPETYAHQLAYGIAVGYASAPAHFEAWADAVAADLQAFPPDIAREAAKEVRRRHKRFPSLADVIGTAEAIFDDRLKLADTIRAAITELHMRPIRVAEAAARAAEEARWRAEIGITHDFRVGDRVRWHKPRADGSWTYCTVKEVAPMGGLPCRPCPEDICVEVHETKVNHRRKAAEFLPALHNILCVDALDH